MDLIESYQQELQLIRKPWTRVWVGALVLYLLLLPWFASEYIVYTATLIFLYSIGVQGQNLLIDTRVRSPLAKRASTHAGHTVVERSLL